MRKIARTKAHKTALWLAVLVWMGVIFYLSHQTGEQSGKLSGGVTEIIVETVEKVVPSVRIDRPSFHAFVRKNAHFAAFFGLGVLVYFALCDTRPRKKALWQAAAFCALYAVFDETHQLFVPGRGAQIGDVLIDSAGAVFGVALSGLVSCRKRRLFPFKRRLPAQQ